MPRHASSTPRPDPAGSSPGRPAPAHLAVGAFTPDEWRLLTRLPAKVMIVAIAVQRAGPRRTVTEGLAGLDAIAAGRLWDSDLIRAVVTAIFAEPEEDRTADRQPFAPPDRADRLAEVLDDCRRAVEVLRAGADPADGAAYLQWVQHIAAHVCRASRSGGVCALPGERFGAAEQEFLTTLGHALR